MMDRFNAGLNYETRAEVLKTEVSTIEEAAKVALQTDSALHCAGAAQDADTSDLAGHQGQAGRVVTENENLQTLKTEAQREGESALEMKACFKCGKIRCRPWTHRAQKTNSTNNFTASSSTTDPDGMEKDSKQKN